VPPVSSILPLSILVKEQSGCDETITVHCDDEHVTANYAFLVRAIHVGSEVKRFNQLRADEGKRSTHSSTSC